MWRYISVDIPVLVDGFTVPFCYFGPYFHISDVLVYSSPIHTSTRGKTFGLRSGMLLNLTHAGTYAMKIQSYEWLFNKRI